ncbi:hypothetical protein BraRD5C2_17840 [Bradyrhizobium sp. RD5-C2]|nr:hypothetical protein BraRD5C2_17840 [Bradyrhizobium sp. RD5-C2]
MAIAQWSGADPMWMSNSPFVMWSDEAGLNLLGDCPQLELLLALLSQEVEAKIAVIRNGGCYAQVSIGRYQEGALCNFQQNVVRNSKFNMFLARNSICTRDIYFGLISNKDIENLPDFRSCRIAYVIDPIRGFGNCIWSEDDFPGAIQCFGKKKKILARVID